MKLPLTQELDVRVVRQLTLSGISTRSRIAQALGSSEPMVLKALERLAANEVVSETTVSDETGQHKFYEACPRAIARLVEQNLALLLAA